MNDLTIIYYTANTIPEEFATKAYDRLFYAAAQKSPAIPMIVVSKKPVPYAVGKKIISEYGRSHIGIYLDALSGAKLADTKYIALCEDDVLYSPEHFNYRPSSGKFAYNVNAWMIYRWQSEAMYSQKMSGRKNLSGLICERELFIEAMEERFAKYPDESKVNLGIWAEPGKYERQLGVTVRDTEVFTTNPPNIVFSHENELSFSGLGTRKKVGEIRATDIPYWGKAEDIRRIYE